MVEKGEESGEGEAGVDDEGKWKDEDKSVKIRSSMRSVGVDKVEKNACEKCYDRCSEMEGIV